MNVREWFDGLSEAVILGLISGRQEEGLYLECKRLNDCSLSDRDDRKNLAIALSGFANSMGGVVLWGMSAAKSPSGPDVISEVVGLDDPALAISQITSFAAQATSPSVLGVHHRIIIVGTKAIVATLVEEGFGDPHMAKLGEDRYYRRHGDRFQKMEHFEIADMFGRRARPELHIFFRSYRPEEFLVGIRNEGRGVAKAPYLALSLSHPFVISKFGVDGNFTFPLKDISATNRAYNGVFGGTAIDVIHPGTEMAIAKIVLPHERRNDPNVPSIIQIEGLLSADGVQTTPFKANLDVKPV